VSEAELVDEVLVDRLGVTAEPDLLGDSFAVDLAPRAGVLRDFRRQRGRR